MPTDRHQGLRQAIVDAAEMTRVLDIFKNYGRQEAAQAPGGAVRRDHPVKH